MIQLLTGFHKYQFTRSFVSSTVVRIHRYTTASKLTFQRGWICLISLYAAVFADLLNDVGSNLRCYTVDCIHVIGRNLAFLRGRCGTMKSEECAFGAQHYMLVLN